MGDLKDASIHERPDPSFKKVAEIRSVTINTIAQNTRDKATALRE